jgi:putative pyruvate formate lyase activating enzyme
LKRKNGKRINTSTILSTHYSLLTFFDFRLTIYGSKLNTLYSFIEALEECTACPRNCRVNRIHAPSGYCKTGAGFSISSICIHRGEEPVIGGKQGICNIFFSGCNLHCIYCQNHEISFAGKYFRTGQGRSVQQANILLPDSLSLQKVIKKTAGILDQGISSVGFVSPSHVVPQVRAIISALRNQGRNPVFVYNTNAYEKAETIRSLDGLIDVYLPDFKYMDASLASELSDAPDYPGIALAAIKEMYRQKGSVLNIDEKGQARSGLIIRHLVLPGHLENSLSVLRNIAEEISTGVAVSLMSQYSPTIYVRKMKGLNRCLHAEEYQQVVSVMEQLGFRKGYKQEMDSSSNYQPDFSRNHPFE